MGRRGILAGVLACMAAAGVTHAQVSQAGLHFDSTRTGSVNAGSASELQFGGTQPFTLEAWVRPDGWTGGDTHRAIISKFNSGSVGAWQFVIRNNNSLGFHREVNPWWMNGNTTVPTGQWRHVAATYDGSVMRTYVNGVLDVQESRGSSSTTTSPVMIGATLNSGQPANRFLGVIDELRVWNVAKSAPQLLADMNTTLAGTEANLVGYWNMNELTSGGTTLPDLSPSGNNGTLSATGVSLITSDLVSSISASADDVEMDEQVTYSISVENKGPMIAGSTVVTVTFPENFVFESTTLDSEDYTMDGDGMTLDPQDLSEGDEIAFDLVLTAAGFGAGTLTVEAEQELDDIVPADNTATEETTVVEPTTVQGWESIMR